MRSALPLAALALAAACADRQVRVSPAASRAMGTPEDACPTADAEVPDFPDERPPDSTPAVTGSPVIPAFQGQPLLPPERPGELVFEALGCLAAERTRAAGARYPASPERPEDAVRVNPLSGGILITHELAHPCCLGATVSATVEGASVRVTEVLDGTPCGCRCASRLRTFISAPPGPTSLQIVLRGPVQPERIVFTGFTSSEAK